MQRENEFIYTKLSNRLRDQIFSGFIKSGEFLLSEVEMAKYYQISRKSVRRALEVLVDENLIIKKVGQGNVVNPDFVVHDAHMQKLNIFIPSPSHFYEICMPIIVEKFNKIYPNVSVKLLSIPSTSFWEFLINAEKSGVQPDILFVSDSIFKQLEYKYDFVELSDLINDELKEVPQKLFQPYTNNGNIFGLPVTFSTIFLAYNPNLFSINNISEPDENWSLNDFIETSTKLTIDNNKDGIIDTYGLSFTPIISRWFIFALQNNIDLNNMSSSLSVLENTLNFIHNILYKNRIAILSSRHNIYSGPFYHEKSGMTLTSFFELAGWKNRQIKFEPKLAKLPFGNINTSLLISNSFAIPTSSKAIQLSKEFLKVASSTKVQKILSDECGFLSVMPNINEDKIDIKTLEYLNISQDNLKNTYYLYEAFPDAELLLEVESELELFWDGLVSAESTAKRLIDVFRKVKGEVKGDGSF